MTLNPQIAGFSKFFAIPGCDTHFKSELRQNGWRLAGLPEIEVAEDHGDVGLMISNSGQEDPLQNVSSVQ